MRCEDNLFVAKIPRNDVIDGVRTTCVEESSDHPSLVARGRLELQIGMPGESVLGTTP